MSSNTYDIIIVGGILVRGHQYLDVRYEDEDDGVGDDRKIVKKVAAIYVWQVYEETDFDLLNISF